MQVNGDAVRRIRKERGISGRTLADRVGLNRNTIDLIERGKTTRPGRLTLAAIAAGLGVTVGDITVRDEAVQQ